MTGRFRFEAEEWSDFPAVGDWVLASIDGPDVALIHSILPRTSVLSRKVAGSTTEEQILAANVDLAFLITAFDGDFNLRRLERFLALIKESGVEPVILLNKSDLANSADDRFDEASRIANGAPVYRVSAITGEGFDAILSHLQNLATGTFLGSSGVGKSTILNRLLGKEVQATQPIRLSDSHGRHTTTSRQMFALPSGGFVIDSPGIREIQLWADSSVLPQVFTDIAQLAERCRFRDCRHQTEAECAVIQALGTGELPKGRWEGYIKLQKELAYLKRKQNPQDRANVKRRWKKIHSQSRDIIKRKRG